jgi:hypothetical protein
MQRRPHPAGGLSGIAGPKPEEFGDEITGDHIVVGGMASHGINGESTGAVLRDRATDWLDTFPLQTKTAADAGMAIREFAGPRCAIQLFYSDNSGELISAARDIGIIHDTSTPERPETNSRAERAVRIVMDGTRSALVHAGMPPSMWPYAAKHYCFSRNIEIRNGDSPWNKRHKRGHFCGPRYPFGCAIHFLPQRSMLKQLPKFGRHAVPGIFLGYHLISGGRWRGDFIVAAKSDFDKAASGDGTLRFRVHRVKEVWRDKHEDPVFPLKEFRKKCDTKIGIHWGKAEGVAERSPFVLPDSAPELEDGFEEAASKPGGVSPPDPQDDNDPAPEPVVRDGSSSGSSVVGPKPVPSAPKSPEARTTGPELSTPKGDDGKFARKGTWLNGRFTLDYKGTSRPPHIWPEVYQLMTRGEKKAEWKKFNAAREAEKKLDLTNLARWVRF